MTTWQPTIFDKLKNIRIVNNFEPRIEFEYCDGNNDGVITNKQYDICLSLAPMKDNEQNCEQAAKDLLESLLAYAELCNK